MGENHKENILKCLKDWRALSLMQGKALSEGKFEEFEKLTKVSVILQSKINNLLKKISPDKPDKESIELLKAIQKLQEGLIKELSKGVKELSQAIATLSKNRTSVKGYRQNKAVPPRFKSERA